jgi:transcriptional regulator with XRE-family HTH domain
MLGKYIRDERRRRGWRQTDLAAKTGLTQAFISMVESGQHTNLRRDALQGLATAFEISIDELLAAAGVGSGARSPSLADLVAIAEQRGVAGVPTVRIYLQTLQQQERAIDDAAWYSLAGAFHLLVEEEARQAEQRARAAGGRTDPESDPEGGSAGTGNPGPPLAGIHARAARLGKRRVGLST